MSDFEMPEYLDTKLPYGWLLAAGEMGVFAVCFAMIAAYFSR